MASQDISQVHTCALRFVEGPAHSDTKLSELHLRAQLVQGLAETLLLFWRICTLGGALENRAQEAGRAADLLLFSAISQQSFLATLITIEELRLAFAFLQPKLAGPRVPLTLTSTVSAAEAGRPASIIHKASSGHLRVPCGNFLHRHFESSHESSQRPWFASKLLPTWKSRRTSHRSYALSLLRSPATPQQRPRTAMFHGSKRSCDRRQAEKCGTAR